MEHGIVTQRAVVLLLFLLHFVSLPNKRLRGLRNTKSCGFRHCANILNSA